MRHIFEEYGDTIIQIIGGIGILGILIELIRPDGVLRGFIIQILEKAC